MSRTHDRAPAFDDLRAEFGPIVADEIGDVEWQMWVDQLSREGLSRSRVAGHVSVASAMYAWGMTPEPALRHAQFAPPGRTAAERREASPPRRPRAEAEELLAALDPPDAVPYAIAFYAGLRPPEIDRLKSPEVLARTGIATRLLVTRAKSEAGRERRPPIAEPLRAVLAAAGTGRAAQVGDASLSV